MCRNIKTLYNFTPPATGDEIRASAVQFARKVSGFTHPSKANEPAFDTAIVTNAPPRDRQTEAAKARGTSSAVRSLTGSG